MIAYGRKTENGNLAVCNRIINDPYNPDSDVIIGSYDSKEAKPMQVRKWQPTLGRNHGNHMAQVKRRSLFGGGNGGDDLVIICALVALIYILAKVLFS